MSSFPRHYATESIANTCPVCSQSCNLSFLSISGNAARCCIGINHVWLLCNACKHTSVFDVKDAEDDTYACVNPMCSQTSVTNNPPEKEEEEPQAITPPIDYDEDGDEDMNGYNEDYDSSERQYAETEVEYAQWLMGSMHPKLHSMPPPPEPKPEPRFYSAEAALEALVKLRDGRHDFVEKHLMNQYLRDPGVGAWFRRRVLMALVAPFFEWDMDDSFEMPRQLVEPDNLCAKVPLLMEYLAKSPQDFQRTLALGCQIFDESLPMEPPAHVCFWHVMVICMVAVCKHINDQYFTFDEMTRTGYSRVLDDLLGDNWATATKRTETQHRWISKVLQPMFYMAWARKRNAYLGAKLPDAVQGLMTCEFTMLCDLKMLVFKLFASDLPKSNVDSGIIASLIKKLRTEGCPEECSKIVMESLLPCNRKIKCRTCPDALLAWLDHECHYDTNVLMGKICWLNDTALRGLMYTNRLRDDIISRELPGSANRRGLEDFSNSIESGLNRTLAETHATCAQLHAVLRKHFTVPPHLQDEIPEKDAYNIEKLVEWGDALSIAARNSGYSTGDYWGSSVDGAIATSSRDDGSVKRSISAAHNKADDQIRKLKDIKVGPSICDSCRAVEAALPGIKLRPACFNPVQLKTAVKTALKKINDEALAGNLLRNYAYLMRTGLASVANDKEILSIVKAGQTNEIRFSILTALLPAYLENSSEVVRTGWFVDSLQPQRLVGQSVITVEVGQSGDFIMQILPNPKRYARPAEALRRMAGVATVVVAEPPKAVPLTSGTGVGGAAVPIADDPMKEVPERRECKVCFEREINTLFVECQHAACCNQCAESSCSAGCPVCRGPNVYLHINYC